MDAKARKVKCSKQILTALLATIPNFTYGVQLGWLSPMKPILKTTDGPTVTPTLDWLAAAFPLAAIIGIPFFSYSSDKFGRKPSIIAISVLDCISWSIKLSVTSVDAPALLVARVVAGLAASGCFVVVPVYIKEIAENSLRGSLASLTMTSCKVGVIFVYAVGMTASYMGNQAVYLTISGVHVLAFLMMPESPNFLLKIGKDKKASRAVAWLRSLKQSDEKVLEELNQLKEERREYEEKPKVTLTSIVNDRASFAALRMTLMLMAMQTLSGCFALMNFAADVFKRAGVQWSPNGLTLFMGALQLAGSFFTTMSVEKFGRKIPLALSSLIVSICMGTMGTCSLLGSGGAVRGAAVCLTMLAYGVGLAPVPMVVMAEVFSFEVRARMAGACMAFSFFCSSMTVLFYAPIAAHFGEYVMFYIFATVTLLGTIYTVFCVPETKGKSLQEIQEYWKKTEPTFV